METNTQGTDRLHEWSDGINAFVSNNSIRTSSENVKENTDVDSTANEATAQPSASTTAETAGEEENGSVFQEPPIGEISQKDKNAHLDSSISGRAPKTSRQLHLEQVAEKLGLRVSWDESVERGEYNFKSRSVILNPNMSMAHMYYEVFKHEFTHFLETKKEYAAFKKYLFEESNAFGKWVDDRLSEIGLETNGSRTEKINRLQNYYYEQYRHSDQISEYIKKQFTTDDAGMEMVADFVGKELFTRKGNIQEGAISDETGLDLLSEMAQNNRNLLQRIIDWIREKINILTGAAQNRSVIEDLKYLEKRLVQVYQSADNKNAATKDGVKYSIINLDNGKSYVQASRKIIHGNNVAEWRLQISNFFNKALEHGPIQIDTVEGDTLTISKDTANKARDINVTENGTTRKLTNKEFLVKLHAESHIDELAEISTKNKNIHVKDKKNHNFAKDGFTYRTVYFQDFDGSYYRVSISVGENNGISTIYNVGKIKANDIPNGNIVSAIGSKADMSSAKYSIPTPTENVKEKQFEIIEKSNPFDETLGNHTWIKLVEDIKTYREAVEEDDATTPDYTEEDLQKALKTGYVTVYSSYPIEDGIFVTPSKMEAQNYAGDGEV